MNLPGIRRAPGSEGGTSRWRQRPRKAETREAIPKSP
jgi:hypothetical protein